MLESIEKIYTECQLQGEKVRFSPESNPSGKVGIVCYCLFKNK